MTVPFNVLATFTDIRARLGAHFSFEELCRYVETHRSKPIIFEQLSLPKQMLGLCVPLADVDLIQIQDSLDPILVLSTRLHELAHLLLSHLPLSVFGSETVTYDEFRAIDANDCGIARRVDITNPLELEAETLSMLLMRCIVDYEQDAPRFAQHLYGPTQ